jgi:hypothetical protein
MVDIISTLYRPSEQAHRTLTVKQHHDEEHLAKRQFAFALPLARRGDL